MRPLRLIPLALAALLLSGPAASAQAIAARVVDTETRLPLRDVSVHVVDADGAVLDSATTDTLGVFYALLARPARVVVKFGIPGHLPFESDTVVVGAEAAVQREFVLPLLRVHTELEVEKRAVIVRGSTGPRYPAALREKGIGGEVLASFVVDSTGHALPSSVKVLRATHPLFEEAVRDALPRMRFLPAEREGHAVAQQVQMPFGFEPGSPRLPVIYTRP